MQIIINLSNDRRNKNNLNFISAFVRAGRVGRVSSVLFAHASVFSSRDFKNSQVWSVIYCVLEKNPTTFPKMTHLKCNNIFFKGPPATVVVDHAQVLSSFEKVPFTLRFSGFLKWFADYSDHIFEYLQR